MSELIARLSSCCQGDGTNPELNQDWLVLTGAASCFLCARGKQVSKGGPCVLLCVASLADFSESCVDRRATPCFPLVAHKLHTQRSEFRAWCRRYRAAPIPHNNPRVRRPHAVDRDGCYFRSPRRSSRIRKVLSWLISLTVRPEKPRVIRLFIYSHDNTSGNVAGMGGGRDLTVIGAFRPQPGFRLTAIKGKGTFTRLQRINRNRNSREISCPNTP